MASVRNLADAHLLADTLYASLADDADDPLQHMSAPSMVTMVLARRRRRRRAR